MPTEGLRLSLFPLLLLAAVVIASVFSRRSRGKPILFFSVPGAVFQERAASGFSNDRWWRRLGGAKHHLVVAITSDRLVICPYFPFNLMFQPETYGIEHDVPLGNVINVTTDRHWLRLCVRVRFRDGVCQRSVSLFLKQPDRFLRLVKPAG